MPLPNGITNPAADQFNNSNDRQDITPLHTRKNFVVRMDQVLNNKVRFSGRMLVDKDDSTTYNAMTTNVGSIDNIYNGAMIAGAMTWVVRPTIVNEITSGYTYDNYGFLYKPGKLTASDYTQWYRNAYNPIINQTLPDPPRLAPYNKLTTDPLSLLKTNCLNCNSDQSLQQPYFPDVSFSGGSRSNYSYFRPSGGSGPLPRQNFNPRFTFQDDLSIVKSRHSFKFGFSLERNAKTEPGGSTVSGSYNFGTTSANPLDTGFGSCPSGFSCGNGYANALLGIFQQYQELDYRVDREDVHWLGEGYAQDTWRVTPRLTLDLGIRFTHSGSMFEINNYNSGFDPGLYNASKAAVLYTPYCSTGVTGDKSCSSSNTFAFDPRYPAAGKLPNGATNTFSRSFQGTVVPGTGVGNYGIANGFFLGGLPGKKPGEYDSLQYMNYGPRFGFAWDVFGDGKTAVRGAAGVFYNFFSCCNYPYNGGPQISVTRSLLNSTFNDITAAAASGNLAVSPAGSGIPRDLGAFNYLAGQDQNPGPFQTSRHYQANFAVQRDVGFSTVVEVAYVGNFGRHYYQGKSVNNIPVDAYAQTKNLFNADAISSNFIRRNFPGVGSLSYVTSDYNGLDYNSLQVSVQRRLSHGFQMGAAYTLAKGQGMRGWDFRTEEVGGAAALRSFYYGPIAVNAESLATDQGQERRHVAVFNYSYQIPAINKPVLKYVLGGWEASGVTTIVTGDAVNPVCNNNSSTSGIANTDPSLSGVGTRCELVSGQSIGDLSAFNTSGVLVEDQAHFNVNALQRPYPTNTLFGASNNVAGPGATGNLGNFPYGGLRNPGWWNWDFTLGRRIPVKMGSRSGNARLQLQFYNLFNQVEFSRVGGTYSFQSVNATGGFGGGNTNTNTGKYTTAQNPYNFSITIRFDY
jgi:hypothetical protein